MQHLEKNRLEEQTADYQHYTAQGSHHDIGVETARRSKTVVPLQASTNGLHFAEKCRRVVSQVFPAILDEFVGYGKTLGASDESLLPHFSVGVEGGCSAVAVRHPEGMIVGRNYDYYYFENRRHLIYTKPNDGYSHIGMHEGLIGGRFDGLNQHGVFVSFNGAGDFPNPTSPGLTFHLIVRLLLESAKTAMEAKDILMDLPVIEPKSYFIADNDAAFVVEVHPQQRRYRVMECSKLVVTNHFEHEDMVKFHGPWANSLSRFKKLESTADVIQQTSSKEEALKGLQQLLADHDAPLCGHIDGLATFWSTTAHLATRTVHYSLGAPCRNQYHVYFRFE